MDELPHHAEPRVSRATELAINLMAAAALVFLALVLSGCGGGSSASGQPFVFTGTGLVRNDLLLAYYGTTSMWVDDTAGHANAVWCPDFHGPEEQLACAIQAKGHGMPAIIMLGLCLTPTPVAETQARFYLQKFHDNGTLGNVVGVVWCDEPNTARSGNWSDAAAQGMNGAVRRAMASFPELHAKLAVIYACKGGYPGASTFDAVGCDDYDSSDAVFQRYYGPLESAAPQAVLIDVMAGADPWRDVPDAMLAHANANPAVWLAAGFIYQTETDGQVHLGIRENGRRAAWCAGYQKFTLKKAACS